MQATLWYPQVIAGRCTYGSRIYTESLLNLQRPDLLRDLPLFCQRLYGFSVDIGLEFVKSIIVKP